jgi:hypothetical protein
MGIGELPQVSVSNCGEPERTHQTNTLYANCFLWGFVWGGGWAVSRRNDFVMVGWRRQLGNSADGRAVAGEIKSLVSLVFYQSGILVLRFN